jgi:glycosyltransferase involved in cell wall biosynthesis
MRNGNKVKYTIVIPARNEEKFIGKVLESIVNQTFLPREVVIVNDNSTDKTEFLIQEFAEKYSFIKLINSENKTNHHLPGSKIIEAFYKGFNQVNSDWDFICKLDADVILPENYFQVLLNRMTENPKIGLAGGLVYINKNGNWIFENYNNKKHIRGAIKTYSKACFQKIDGLKKSMGWDTVDELLAEFHGFEIAVYDDLIVKLLKPTGVDYKQIRYGQFGKSYHLMDYGIPISIIAAAKASWKAKNVFSFFSIMRGYFKSVLNGDSKIVTKDEGKFIRRFRWAGILNRFLNHS